MEFVKIIYGCVLLTIFQIEITYEYISRVEKKYYTISVVI